jgi:hypothetical protein
MARPRKEQHERRSAVVRFVVRPSEYLRIAQAAGAARKSLSTYARELVLKGRIVVRRSQGLDHDAFDQVRRIGVNLNQAVRLFNATGRPPPELAAAVAAVERILTKTFEDGAEGRR